MTSSIEQMLCKYRTDTPELKKNAIKEIMQEIVLCGLSRAGFFRKAAFYGGTALRIFYGLDRFSEDLDFSLVSKDLDFDFSQYFPYLERELQAYGIMVYIHKKDKSSDSNISSAFLKGNTREQILLFYADERLAGTIAPNEAIKIKLEVDVNPPDGATYESLFRMLPSPYSVRLYDQPSLFAGKLHAVICRAWRNRVKGRDLYDYVFYMSRGTKVNLSHLKARLVESGAIDGNSVFDIDVLRSLLCERFDSIDYASAKEDVRSFISDPTSLDVWCPEFFKQTLPSLESV